MGFVKEFREFALKGNVFDLAVGVIIGAAFGKIVASLLENCINPVLGLVGGVSFTEMYLMLSETATFAPGMKYTEAKAHGAALGYGQFITDIINFAIMALVVFLMVKMFNTARRRLEQPKPAAAPAPPPGPSEKDYLREIRDLLSKRA